MKYAQIFALALLAALLAACSGCATIQGIWDKYGKPEIEKPDQPDQPDQPEQPQSDDAVPFGNLRWNRGGANFAGAQRDSRVTIRNVAVLEDALVALLGNPAAGQVTGQVAGQVEKK